MKIYKTQNDSMRVGAMEKDGKYIIIIEKPRKMLVATKGNRNAHIETDYNHYEKAFETAEQANRYFMGIKKNNPTLKEI